jgi:hypothetical protein
VSMSRVTTFILSAAVFSLTFSAIASPPADSLFSAHYHALSSDLLTRKGEIVDVDNFVYQKDVATFTFSKGKFLLQREVNSRPTLAIFVGKGTARVDIPSHVGRCALQGLTKDSLVEEEFTVCFIRFGDNFDLKLKSAFGSREGSLSIGEFRDAKKAQGQFFFKPIAWHGVDNYFQLLRSAYDRTDDGYFWADFNRYVFTFDPNVPEEVQVSYDREMSSLIAIPGARFQRAEHTSYEDTATSHLNYAVTCLGQSTEFEFGGLDGANMKSCRHEMTLRINRDSTRFVSLFLDRNLQLDSLHCVGVEASYHRRHDFPHVGIILPDYLYRDDTLKVVAWYHGTKYGQAYMYVLDNSPAPHAVTIKCPSGYNYYVEGTSRAVPTEDGLQRIEVEGTELNDLPAIMPLATGYDTTIVATEWGLDLRYLCEHGYNYTVKEEDFKGTVEKALRFMYDRLGPPPCGDRMWVTPRTIYSFSLAGAMGVLDYHGEVEYGGFHLFAGRAAARQWCSTGDRLCSYRERWLKYAIPEYLTLMFIEQELGEVPFYTSLSYYRESMYSAIEDDLDLPLGTGSTVSTGNPYLNFMAGGLTCKGIWLLHMLRNLMYDEDAGSDAKFIALLRDFIDLSKTRQVSNADFIRLAEENFGFHLDWFFRQWLYGIGIPHYDVTYSTESTEAGHMLNMHVVTHGVSEPYLFPILLRFDLPDGPAYVRQFISCTRQDYVFGPFEQKPEKLYFNEYYSALSKDDVERR